jgi:hypothetical protein
MAFLNLDADSADFTSQEAESAREVDTVSDVIDHMRGRECPECYAVLFPTLQEQRRRSGVLYWRVFLACPSMHEELLVFKVRAHQPPR